MTGSTPAKLKTSKCGICNKHVSEKAQAVQCDSFCDMWYHAFCIGLTDAEYQSLANSDVSWNCEKCSIKECNKLLKLETESLNQVITTLNKDLIEFKNLYEESTRRITCLNELVIKREEEIARLGSELDSCSCSRARSPEHLRSRLSPSLSTQNFPPLNLSNRFTNLSIDEEANHLPSEQSSSSGSFSGRLTSRKKTQPTESSSKTLVKHSSFSNFRSSSSFSNFRPSNKSNTLHNPNLTSPVISRSKPIQDTSTPIPTGNSATPEPRPNTLPEKKPVPPRNPNPSGPRPVTHVNKKKILIMCDSHGRDVAAYMTVLCQDRYEIFSICRPSAKFHDVIEGLNKYLPNMNSDDVVICLGGSNDIIPGLKSVLTCQVKQKLSCLKKQSSPKVILINLPLRHDRPNINDTIVACNHDLKTNSFVKDFKILDFGSFEKKNFSSLKNGLTLIRQHLSKNGKIFLCKQILLAVNSLFLVNK